MSHGARSSATASSRRSPAGRGAARAAGTFCAENRFSLFVPCHRVVAAGGIGGYGSLGVEYKRRLLASRGGRPDSLRRPALGARGDRAEARLLPARRDLGALPLRREHPPARPRRDRAPSRPRHLGGRAPRVLAAARARDPLRRSAPTAAARSTAPPATSSTSPGTSPRSQMLVEAGVLDARTRRSSGRRSASSGAPVAAVPTCAARCSAAARSPGRGRRTSSCGRPRWKAPSSCRRSPPPATRIWASSTAAATLWPTRRDSTRSKPCSSCGRRGRHRPRLRGAVGDRGRPRSRRTDSRTPTTPISSARAAPRTNSSRRCARSRLRARSSGCRTVCTRSHGFGSGIRPCRCASWRHAAEPPVDKGLCAPPASKAPRSSQPAEAGHFSLVTRVTQGENCPTRDVAGPCSSGDGFRPRPSSAPEHGCGGGGRPRSSPSGPRVFLGAQQDPRQDP